jgi:predicted porin
VGNADTVAYYVEGRYQFAPDLFAALRWNQQLFNSLPKGEGESGDTPWGSDLDRIDAAMTYRFSPHLQAKIQYSYLIQDDPVPSHQNFVAAQITLRF